MPKLVKQPDYVEEHVEVVDEHAVFDDGDY